MSLSDAERGHAGARIPLRCYYGYRKPIRSMLY
jgi:hypothetical protein